MLFKHTIPFHVYRIFVKTANTTNIKITYNVSTIYMVYMYNII